MTVPSTGNLIDVYRLPGFTLVATPIRHHGITYQPQKSGPGTGGFTIPLDDPAYDDIQINDLAAIRRNGETVAVIVIERIEEHTLDIDGAARQVASYIGGLQGAVLGWANIAPAFGDGIKPIEDDSVWDVRSPRYDTADDDWEPANEIMTVAAAEAGAWPHQPMGQRFDLTTGAMMISSSDATDELAPPGWYIFLRDITVTTGGRWGLETLMDDHGEAWVNGIQQLDVPSSDGFVTASFKRLTLTAGIPHRFVWPVFNFENPEEPGEGLGPSALAYNLYKCDLQDQPLTGDNAELYISDSNTQVLYVGLDDPWPGMRIDQILLALIEEAQDRGAITWVAPSFGDGDDSNGDPFERLVGVTTKTGTTTLLQFLDELVAAERISRWRMRPDAVTFDVFGPDYDPANTIEIEPVTSTNPLTGEVLLLDRVIT